jgi:cell division protein FtsB
VPASRAPRQRPVLTGRALVLGVVVVLLVVVLASPIHRYLASRSAVTDSAQQLQNDRTALAKLKKQQALYADPGYIQQQARARLQYAMPGDTVYVVVDKGAKSDIEKQSAAAKSASGTTAWNSRLWASVRAAGQ